jgi:hypothetical protein
MNLGSTLVAASALLLGTLGAIHLLYTFRGNKLEPRDPAVRAAMEGASYVLTRETTVWRATKGFNASHSQSLVAIAVIYGHLALWQPQVLAGSLFLQALGMMLLLGYLVLARRYFFSIPLRGVALACALYAAGWALL